MIYGIGIDVTDLARIKKIQEQHPRLMTKVLTPQEQLAYRKLSAGRQLEFLAGRFSAKEAYSKAWGTGLGQLSLQDVEILNTPAGQPQITRQPFSGQAWISISHTATIVMTQVILETSSAKEQQND